jgi:hypothetical protein
MGKFIDITGRRFGRWTVFALHPKRYRGGTVWHCRCDCGTERVVNGGNLRHGVSTSCGCIAREKTIKRCTKHGHSRRGKVTSIYQRWLSMLQRCFNPNNAAYCHYGDRGITVHERWLDFVGFYADVGEPPPGLWLDRINNDGDYEPWNWRWAPPWTQVVNRRRRKKSNGAR